LGATRAAEHGAGHAHDRWPWFVSAV
jgi:hypothetical protein